MTTSAASHARIPVLAGLGTFVLHAVTIFAWLPPAQFHKYDAAARELLAGTLPPERPIDFSPLYLWLHLLVQWLGIPTHAITVLQLLAVGLAAGLLCDTLMARFPTRIALGGTALFALDQGIIMHTRLHEPEALVVCTIVAVLWCVLGGRAAWKTGALVAVGMLLRPTLVLLAPGAVVHARLNGRPWRRELAVLVGPMLAWCVQAAWLQGSVGDARAPLMNPGTVFYEGNNGLSEGVTSVYPPLMFVTEDHRGFGPDAAHEMYRQLARACEDRALSPAEVNASWFARGLHALVLDGRRAAALLARKWAIAMHHHPSHDVVNAYILQDALQESWFPFLGGALLSALGLTGLLRLFRREQLLVLLVLGMQWAVILVFYASARQRLPLVPALVIAACAAVQWATERRRNLVVGLVSASVLFTVFRMPMEVLDDERHLLLRSAAAQQMSARAARLRDDGDLPGASELVARAMATAPWMLDGVRVSGVPVSDDAPLLLHPVSDASTHSDILDHALLLLHAGRLDDAETLLAALKADGSRFNRRARQSSCVDHHRAIVALRKGNEPAAVRLLEDCLVDRPSEPYALALLHVLRGDEDSRAALAATLGKHDVSWMLGMAALVARRADVAVEHLAKVSTCWPRARAATVHLASAYALAGKNDEGVRVYLDAMKESSDPVMDEEAIVPMFRAWAAEDPQRREMLVTVLRQFGHAEEARAVAKP